ncbi:ATP-NAD kinase-like domain-containing protein [Lipomyces arxii]|uniref:ATP-NAD kinase-like domain-containing protein n=1 Tax=Lipomyces arxii TaxID=56418 RepID=UPI0034CDEAF0
MELQKRRFRRLSKAVTPPANVYSQDPIDKEDGSFPVHELPPSTGYSRLLTKKQLAEMAFSVRDLSKYLGTLKIKLRVRKILIITKIWDKETVVYTSEITDWLLGCGGDNPLFTVYVENVLENDPQFDAHGLTSKDLSRSKRLKYWTNELCEKHPQMFDLVVTLGGDGTVLYSSRLFQRIVPPVLSFNLGSLGFLTKFDFSHYKETLKKLIDDGVVVSLRMRFECTVMKSKRQIADENLRSRNLESEILDQEEIEVSHEPGETFSILNDVVIGRGPSGTMATAELYIDDEHVTSIEADGVVIATPTGSTAYSLSAGGSLVHPDIQCMLISPICAHSLSFRPLVVPDSVVIRIGIPYSARTTAWCCFDGKDNVELVQGDYVTISASRFPFPMIQSRKLGPDWFESLRTTLNWNQRQTQKAFDNK